MAAATTLALLTFDVAYLRALRKGDAETERHFVTYFSPLIRRKIRKYLRLADLVEEGTQETLARVVTTVRAGRGVRHPDRFGAFVHAVSRNVAMEIMRREVRFVALDEAGDEPSRSDNPERAAEAQETRSRVRKVLASLAPLDRELLEAVFLAEEDRPGICRRFGVTDGYLRVLLHRAKQRFIEQMSNGSAQAERQAKSLPGNRSRSSASSGVNELALAQSA